MKKIHNIVRRVEIESIQPDMKEWFFGDKIKISTVLDRVLILGIITRVSFRCNQ